MDQKREEELLSSPTKSHASSTVPPFMSPRNSEDEDDNENRYDDVSMFSLSEASSVNHIESPKELKLLKNPKQLSQADFGKDIFVSSSINNNKKSRGCAEKMQEEIKRLRELATHHNDNLCPMYSNVSLLDDRPCVQLAQKSKIKRGYWKVSSSSIFVQKTPYNDCEGRPTHYPGHVKNQGRSNRRGSLSLLPLGRARQSSSSSLRQLPSSARRTKHQSVAQ